MLSNGNARLDPTAPPRRSDDPPREGVPIPTLDKGSPAEHFRKHPSDYHADCATGYMIRAENQQDSAKRGEDLALADIHAKLSLRDAALELAATWREETQRNVEATDALRDTTQKATRYILRELRSQEENVNQALTPQPTQTRVDN